MPLGCGHYPLASRSPGPRMSVLLEHRHRPLARGIESIQVGHGPLHRPEIHLVVRVAKVIAESADGAPRYLRLVHLGERAQLDRGLGYLKEAHSNGIVDDTLVRQDALQPSAIR